jgi:leucyl aminopeptidase
MLNVRLAVASGMPTVLAVPVQARDITRQPADDAAGSARDARAQLPPTVLDLPAGSTGGAAGAGWGTGGGLEEATALLAETGHTGQAGVLHTLARPLHRPARLLLVGIGDGQEADWRAAGAAVTRAANSALPREAGFVGRPAGGGRPRSTRRETSVTIALPAGLDPAALRGLAEGLWLASYRYRLGADPGESAPKLRQVTLLVDHPDRYEAALEAARITAESTFLARDLTNTPSVIKNPDWFAREVRKAAARLSNVTVTVRDEKALADEGFGGILAVGSGSASPPRLVELSWRPRGARTHVVLVGKGITFDSGGISIKPRGGMVLMRKDMGGAAAIMAGTLAAAALRLPVRVTALAPLAENMVSGSSYRPGDVVRHYGGMTSEIRNTDAEGRLVLADALSYAVRRLKPDLLVDLATLTGANSVALGKRTAALYSDDDELAQSLEQAATQAGEQVWRMPLANDYVEYLGSDIADLNNHPDMGASSVVAALYLREFVGAARDRWAHVDMSAPSWSERADGELARGATGWGVRTLVRWLSSLADPA